MEDYKESTRKHLAGEDGEGDRRWVVETESKPPELKPYEIGAAFYGCVDPLYTTHAELFHQISRQREILTEFLNDYGYDFTSWQQPPKIIEFHNHKPTVGVSDFGRKLTAPAPGDRCCQWAVYGILRLEEPPEKWYVPEGVRIPNLDRQDGD